MSDNFDPALAAGAIGSIVVFAICGIVGCLYKDCKQQRKSLKQSRSDPDLENMIQEAIPSASAGRYASPQAPASTTSLHTVSSFE
jgi:hypothetical protein